MKRTMFLILALSFIIAGESAKRDRNPGTAYQIPEPQCACKNAEIVLDLGGSLKLDYKEMNVCTMDDGSLLVQDRNTDKYYILKSGVIKGPYSQEDPAIMGFANCYMDAGDSESMLMRYKGILTRSNDKFMISFNGKSYGPFTEIINFTVSTLRDKFATFAYKHEGEFDVPVFVTNIPGAVFDISNNQTAFLSNRAKYNEIVVFAGNKIVDLQGKTLCTLNDDFANCATFFVSSDNSKYAGYDYSTLKFSNKTSLADLFNPNLVKAGGAVYLSYMYYSPSKNSIMQCRIPF